MSASRDPKWFGLATRLFDAALWLYPARLRHAHGEEMRQAFRDRCREASAGRGSMARLFLLELLPDTLHSALGAQFDEGFAGVRARHALVMAMLLLSLALLGFQDAVSGRLLDWTFRARYAYFSAQAARALSREERQVRGLAEALAAEPSAASKAQAAYLYRGLYRANLTYSVAAESAMEVIMAARAIDEREVPIEGDREYFGALAADGDQATMAVNAAQAGKSGWIAAAAALSCLPQAGCDRRAAVARLTALEPDNAYGWSLQFKQAMAAHDDGGARRALAGMATSRHYDDHLGEIRREIFASSRRLLPDNNEGRAAVARRVADNVYIGTDDFVDDVRLQCSNHDRSPPTWAASHPESEADCLRVANLLSRSPGPFDAWRGWVLLAERDSSPATRSALDVALKSYVASASRIGSTPREQGHGWIPWTTGQWNDWAEAQ